MIKIIHGITGNCATKNTAKKGAGSYTRWNENGHVFVIDARGWGASRCGRRGQWSGCTYPPTHLNASSSLLPPSLLSDPHQYQPAVLIKDDNLSIYILISIVDKDFPRWGLAEGLDAAWQSSGSPGSPTG